MTGFPFAKINLGLSILSKRADGFHDLETVFYPLPLCDVLELVPAEAAAFYSTGIIIPGAPAQNLVVRACELLRNDFPQIPPLEIHLHKAIPSGAGLGGGSSDGAFMLNMLNDFFHLHIPRERLASFALALGSDCPFFLQASPCFARGQGEILEPLELGLSACSLLLVQPEIAVSTAWAFSRAEPSGRQGRLKEIIRRPIGDWRDELRNDFEEPVFREYPALKKIREQLYEAGALYAAMTGSGSALYGIFPKNGYPDGGIETTARQYFMPSLK